MIRRILETYASHPAVIGFQVDNEPGAYLIHNPHTFAAFREWLRAKYGDVKTLNREWGLVSGRTASPNGTSCGCPTAT